MASRIPSQGPHLVGQESCLRKRCFMHKLHFMDINSAATLTEQPFAPAGTPGPIVERLNAEVQKVLQVSNVRERIFEADGDPRGSTPEEMRNMDATELQRWAQVITEAKIPRQ